MTGLFRSPRSIAASIVALCWILSPTGAGAQQANAVLVADAQTRKILVTHNADARVPVASLTKLATVCVTVDWAQNAGVSLATLTTVPASIQVVGGQNPAGLQAGDQISYNDLIYACMLASDNVAAHALADAVGRELLRRLGKSGNPPGFFVEQMNHLAGKLGMSATEFVNPHGLETGKRKGLSTASDMAKLAIYALDKSGIRFIMAQKRRDITVIRGGQPIRVSLENTNQMLGAGKIDGMKTGMTAAAGGCLILTEGRKSVTMANPATGKQMLFQPRLVAVVLGSQDRFREGGFLLQNGWTRYDQWIAAGRPVEKADELLSTAE